MYWCFYFIFRQNGNCGLENRLTQFINISSGYGLKTILGYSLYGLWVHFRIYPIIFLPILIVNEYYLSKKTK